MENLIEVDPKNFAVFSPKDLCPYIKEFVYNYMPPVCGHGFIISGKKHIDLYIKERENDVNAFCKYVSLVTGISADIIKNNLTSDIWSIYKNSNNEADKLHTTYKFVNVECIEPIFVGHYYTEKYFGNKWLYGSDYIERMEFKYFQDIVLDHSCDLDINVNMQVVGYKLDEFDKYINKLKTEIYEYRVDELTHKIKQLNKIIRKAENAKIQLKKVENELNALKEKQFK